MPQFERDLFAPWSPPVEDCVNPTTRAVPNANQTSAESRSKTALFPTFVIPDARRLRIGVRPEVAQRHERLGAGVVELHAVAGGVVADEYLVLRQLAVADHGRRVQAVLADPAAALHGNQAIGAVVADRHLDAGIDRQ